MFSSGIVRHAHRYGMDNQSLLAVDHMRLIGRTDGDVPTNRVRSIQHIPTSGLCSPFGFVAPQFGIKRLPVNQ